MTKLRMDNRVIIEEQGLRDGIQNLPKIFNTETKLSYINALVDAGVERIQIASFVHPKLVPQMADSDELCKRVDHNGDALYSGLALNLRGVQRAIDSGLKHVSCSISASSTHSQKNARKTLNEARLAFEEMVSLAKSHQLKVRGGIQCAFGCRYEGQIKRSHVYDMVKSHLEQGIDELALADSTGMANPMQMFEMMSMIVDMVGDTPVILHLHNTENKGYANLFAALNAGVRIFDTAFGGLGGCPFIKSATGNIASEDTVHMLHQMGYETGINLEKLTSISKRMSEDLGHKLPGHMYTLIGTEDIEII